MALFSKHIFEIWPLLTTTSSSNPPSPLAWILHQWPSKWSPCCLCPSFSLLPCNPTLQPRHSFKNTKQKILSSAENLQWLLSPLWMKTKVQTRVIGSAKSFLPCCYFFLYLVSLYKKQSPCYFFNSSCWAFAMAIPSAWNKWSTCSVPQLPVQYDCDREDFVSYYFKQCSHPIWSIPFMCVLLYFSSIVRLLLDTLLICLCFALDDINPARGRYNSMQIWYQSLYCWTVVSIVRSPMYDSTVLSLVGHNQNYNHQGIIFTMKRYMKKNLITDMKSLSNI